MPLIVGAVLAVGAGVFARTVGLDRDRAFYPTVMIVIALLYVLFAAMGGSTEALVLESLVAVGFIVLAVLGFRLSLWWAVAALALHGITDLFHGQVISNPGTPHWWPHFCFAYDAIAAALLAWLIAGRRIQLGDRKSLTGRTA